MCDAGGQHAHGSHAVCRQPPRVGQLLKCHVAFGPDTPTFWVLLPQKDAESVFSLDAKLQADHDYKTLGAEHHSRPASNPGYVRIESPLMIAAKVSAWQ